MKYSFVIPYYNRPALWNTLLSFEHFYKDRLDYEILILEDRKNYQNPEWHAELCTILDRYKGLPIVYRKMNYENLSCPCSTINDGVDIAKGTYVIMTNPECMHMTDILGGMDTEFAEKGEDIYIVCGCMDGYDYDMKTVTFSDFKYKDHQWYQHSVYAPYHLNFCSVISKKNYISMWGFNEELDKGIGRADVDFLNMVTARHTLVLRDDLLTVHQSHPESYPTDRKQELVDINYSCRIFTSRFKREGMYA